MGIDTEFTGNAKPFEREIAKLNRANTRLQEKIQKLTQTASKGGREQQRLGREAKKVYDQTRTPAERYQQRLQQLNELVKKGAINEETRKRAARQAYQEMVGGTQQAKQGANALTGAIQQGTAALQGMVGGLLGGEGVRMAVGYVREAFREWREEMKQLGEQSHDLYDNLMKDMTEAGDLASAVKIKAAIETMPGVTRSR